MTEKLIPIGDLLALEVQEQEARILCDGGAFVEWHKLARRDGGLALAVLDDEDFDLLVQELRRAGLPSTAPADRKTVLHLVWAVAEGQVPPAPWYDRELHSAVACANLLTLAYQAWGYDAKQEAERESESFAKLLGVATDVEPV